jgi:hypothetical protein
MPPTSASDKADLIFDNNRLKGVLELTQMGPIVKANKDHFFYYVLDHPDYPNRFIKVTDLQLSAGRAYLEMPVSIFDGGAKAIITFEDDVTDGITLIDGDEQNAGNIYDIQGRKVENPTKGIYIVNGKKVVVK